MKQESPQQAFDRLKCRPASEIVEALNEPPAHWSETEINAFTRMVLAETIKWLMRP